VTTSNKREVISTSLNVIDENRFVCIKEQNEKDEIIYINPRTNEVFMKVNPFIEGVSYFDAVDYSQKNNLKGVGILSGNDLSVVECFNHSISESIKKRLELVDDLPIVFRQSNIREKTIQIFVYLDSVENFRKLTNDYTIIINNQAKVYPLMINLNISSE